MSSSGISSTIEAIDHVGAEPSACAMVQAVPVSARTRYTDRPIRPNSTFVAQLMAIDQHYPQTHDGTSTAPEQAVAAYRSVDVYDRAAAPAGTRMRRSS